MASPGEQSEDVVQKQRDSVVAPWRKVIEQPDPPLYIEVHEMRWSSTSSYYFYVVRCKEPYCSSFQINAMWPKTALGLAEWHRERCGQMAWGRASSQPAR